VYRVVMTKDAGEEAAAKADEAIDIVEEADEESFPASDPPARTVVTGISDRPLPPEEDRDG
jgi:hypothetical protein